MKKIIVALFALSSMVAFADNHNKAAGHGSSDGHDHHAEAPKAKKAAKKAKKAAPTEKAEASAPTEGKTESNTH